MKGILDDYQDAQSSLNSALSDGICLFIGAKEKQDDPNVMVDPDLFKQLKYRFEGPLEAAV